MNIPKIETQMQVFNAVDDDVAEMYLYGPIMRSSWYNEDTITAKKVRELLEQTDAKTIRVHLNSGGGDVFESIAIGNLFKQSSATIEIYVDALAGSGASIILMSGDKRIMYSNAMAMIHQASTYAHGNADELKKVAGRLEKIDSAVTASYKSNFVGTDEELVGMLKESTWLTAEECLALGFCTEIYEEPKKQEEEPQTSMKDTVLNKYMGDIKNKESDPVEPLINENHEEKKLDTKDLFVAFTNGFIS